MRRVEHAVRRAASQRRVGAIPHCAERRLVRVPANVGAPELIGHRHVHDHRSLPVDVRLGGAHQPGAVLIARLNHIAIRDLHAPVRRDRSGREHHRAGEDARVAVRPQRDRFGIGLRGARQRNLRRGASGEIKINQPQQRRRGRGVRRAIEDHHADAGQRQVARDHQRKILIHRRRVAPRVLDHVARPHPHDVFAGQRRAQMDALDVVDRVEAGRARD